MTVRTRTAPDPRHCIFRTILEAYWRDERNELVPDLPWGPGEAGALSAFLKANPRLSGDGFRRLLQHRLDSEDHARGEPVKLWIGALTRYANGPLNKYKQPKERSSDGNRADQRHSDIRDATSAALDRIRGMAGDQAGRDRRLPGQE